MLVTYLLLASIRMGLADAISRAVPLLMFVGLAYLIQPKKPAAPAPNPNPTAPGPVVAGSPTLKPRIEEPRKPVDEDAARKSAEPFTALQALEATVQTAYDQVQKTIDAIVDKTKALNEKVTEAVSRLRQAETDLEQALNDLEQRLSETRTVRLEVLPTRRADPELAGKAQPFVQAILASEPYRASVAALANDHCLTHEIAYHLDSLLRRSSLLYTRSVLKRGPSSPRMQAWAKDNSDAADSLQKVRPLLRRLQRLDGSQQSVDEFVADLRSPEVTAMGLLLARNRDAVGTEQQVRAALELIAKGILRLWLAPTIRLYQLLYEALPIEDEQFAEWPARLAGLNDDPSILSTLDSVRSAVATLRFDYVHHPLYVTNPYEIQAKVDQTTRRISFADWIAGETGNAHRQPIGNDTVGRVTVPHFQKASSRPFETEIMIILRDQ
ncbi:MAG TPA: hypothetical protein VF432_15790 [Thermoanaerobaculia bacterium]